ncbi:hypothetical protein HN51_023513 [Arachis hypogaea]
MYAFAILHFQEQNTRLKLLQLRSIFLLKAPSARWWKISVSAILVRLDILYAEIWEMDEKDPLVGPEGGESVKDVACRLTRAVTIMESEYEGCAILVVSHGDPLQILQTILLESIQQQEHPNKDMASILSAVQVAPILSQHRKYALVTGELRRVV